VITSTNLTLDILEDVVAEVVSQQGEFWKNVPPAIMHGGRCMAIRGDRDGLNRMREVVSSSPYMQTWVPAVDDAFAKADRTQRVLAFISEHPDTLQKDLAATLGDETDLVGWTCWMLEEDGRIYRQPRGRSYELTVADDEPPG
jgi:hypothetical protein